MGKSGGDWKEQTQKRADNRNKKQEWVRAKEERDNQKDNRR
jgi:hypothetical protein